MSHRIFSWREAIIKSDLSPTTRLVLLTISAHINDMNEAAYPGVDRLAAETGLSRRAVIEHIAVAEREGWVGVRKFGFAGQKWRRNSYHIRIPDRAVELIAQFNEKWAWEKTRMDRLEADEATVEPDEKVVHQDHLADAKVVTLTQKVVHQDHTNIPVEHPSKRRILPLPSEEGGGLDLLGMVKPRKTRNKDPNRFAADFEVWLASYPLQEDPDAAAKAYRAVRNANPTLTATELLDATRRYAASMVNSEQRYIKSPANFLRDGRWRGEMRAPSPTKTELTPAQAAAIRSDVQLNAILRQHGLALETGKHDERREFCIRNGIRTDLL